MNNVQQCWEVIELQNEYNDEAFGAVRWKISASPVHGDVIVAVRL